jgi:hypothetical protein
MVRAQKNRKIGAGDAGPKGDGRQMPAGIHENMGDSTRNRIRDKNSDPPETESNRLAGA